MRENNYNEIILKFSIICSNSIQKTKDTVSLEKEKGKDLEPGRITRENAL